jgi:glycosyltransferase involved in cell wall biosynthesis
MKLAHIGTKGMLAHGGTERVLEGLVEIQARQHEVTVYGQKRKTPRGEKPGVRSRGAPVIGGRRIGPVVLDLYCALHALLLGDFDVVHLHGSENGFVAPLLAFRFPVVGTSHGKAYELAKWGPLARILMRASEAILMHSAQVITAVGRPLAEDLGERYSREVRFIPNGVELEPVIDHARAAALRETLHLHSKDYWVFPAGRLDPAKGCHVLLQAYRGVPDAPPLVIIGDIRQVRRYGDYLEQLASGLQVTFLPKIENKPLLLGLLSEASLAVFASRSEAMSMMLLETAMLEVPLIVSDIPAYTTVVGRSASVFASEDVRALRRLLVAQAEKEQGFLRGTERQLARDMATRYSWEAISGMYEAAYAAGIARYRRSVGWA